MSQQRTDSSTPCFGHLPYASQGLATNAATLHGLAYPACEGAEAWACGDHWHIGHHTAGSGHRCKTDPGHQETTARLDRVLHRRRTPSST